VSARPAPEATIDLAALRGNFALAQRLAGEAAVIAVIKADAYGHGAVPAARALAAAGCTRFAVARVGEGVALREAGVTEEILVLGGVSDAAEAEAAVAQGLVPVAHHAEEIALLAGAVAGAAGRPARAGAAPGAAPPALDVQLEVDTGMRRSGPSGHAAGPLLARLAQTPGLRLAGLFTHLARADEPDLEPSRQQLREFRSLLASLPPALRAGKLLVHAANSAGLLLGERLGPALPGAPAVRPGLLLYGVSPFATPGAPGAAAPGPLRPVLRLATRVVDVRRVEAGEAVGYGASWRAPRATTVATLAAGYADGVPWSLGAAGGRGAVLVRGRRRALVGRVSMDLVTVDAGEAPVAVGDEAVLIGDQAGERIRAEEVAAAAGTIAYEVLSRIAPRVRRRFVDGDGEGRGGSGGEGPAAPAARPPDAPAS